MTSNATCADLKPHITFNSSTTRQIPALRIAGSSSDEIAVQNDTSRSQDLTLGIKPAGVYSMQDIINNNTEYLGSTSTLLLDTGDSDVTDMGACHNTIHPSHFGSWFHFTKERMMKSLSDNRDYTALLSEACVKALKTHYLTQAANVSMRGQACEDYNSTLPRDRAYLQVIPTPMDLNRGLSSLTYRNSSMPLSPSLDCDGVTASTTHRITLGPRTEYDRAVRFPMVDIVTFWPNRSEKGEYNAEWMNNVAAEVLCLKPDNIAEGSRIPPDGKAMLDADDVGNTFPTGAGVVMRGGVLGWVSAVVVGSMLVL